MAARSFSATPESLEVINRAMTVKQWSRDDLAEVCDCSRQPAVKFCSGKSVSKKLFVSFCNELDLDWEEIAGSKVSQRAKIKLPKPEEDIDVLVKELRRKIKEDIEYRCGTMRVLDMEQPIGIGDIYTSVNIVEKLLGHRRLSVNELLEEYDIENFDRFALGRIRQRRVLGLEAVEQHDKLMVLGKPGAGKTTFLKRLATLCNQSKFQAERAPVFITLKEFAEAQGCHDLETYITQQWKQCGVQEPYATARVLTQGRALILLDGLDEVQEKDHQRVLQVIKDFSHQFRACQFVMTCRIAAKEYTFEQFTEVEVTDFDDGQIAKFAKKWFSTKRDPKKSETFIQRLKNNKPIKELATNPLLLTLLCLAFGEAADFPANRAELYKEVLDVLLKKWDVRRNIERDQVYKKLSLKRKEDLFGQLAFYSFDRGDYFFKQSVVERQIVDYIRNLSGAKDDEEGLQLDGADVLASIEAQHGLLVERAKGIYSFSHLTFQEYFTAKQITRSTGQLCRELEKLSEHITEKRYREIFLLAVGMLSEADDLLRLMKQKTDQCLVDDSKLQKFLHWLNQKSKSVNVSYKDVTVRAFYLALSLDRSLDLARSLDRSLDSSLDRSLDLAFDFDLDHNLTLALALEHSLDCSLTLDYDRDRDLALALALALALDLALVLANNFELKLKLEVLKTQLPSNDNVDTWKQWWIEQGKCWMSNMRSVMIEHRNIGYDWQFTDEQKEKLQQYFNVNQLLVNCLNSDCYVTKATRQEIENTLLLPMSEIEEWQDVLL